jgi:cell division protein FtsL
MFFVGKRDQNLGIRKRTVEKRFFLGPTSVKVVILVVLAAFSLFYLSQSSQSATKNYEISDLTQQEKDLNSQKQRLEVEANRLKALSIIQDKASQKGMEQVSE